MSISCIISVCILLVTNVALENGVVIFMKAILEDRIVGRNERMNMNIMLGCVSEPSKCMVTYTGGNIRIDCKSKVKYVARGKINMPLFQQ